MSKHKDAKTMARSLRVALAERNFSLSHSECLELVARQFGLTDWNTLSAKLLAEEGRLARPRVPERAPATVVRAHTLSCSFCGKSRHDVRGLFEGGCSRPRRTPQSCVFICDECVMLCAQINADTLCNAVPPQPECSAE
jgi:Glyoxalase superfamily protein/ClpX C4-type zinc finger